MNDGEAPNSTYWLLVSFFLGVSVGCLLTATGILFMLIHERGGL